MARLFHFRSFWNFLGRNKLFTAINIFGFAVSLMFVLLLGLYVQDELSVDSFHENKERIYRLEADDGAQFAPGLAPAMAARYPEIEAWTRICTKDRYTLDPIAGYTDETVDAEILLTDSSFFSIFSFPFVEGNPATVMHTWDDVVLTESFARRLFGHEPAMGKVISTRGIDYTVSGVVRDFEHTHFRHPDMIVPIDNWLRSSKTTRSFLAGQMNTLNDNADILIYFQGRRNADLSARLDTAELNRCFKQELRLRRFVENISGNPHLNRLENIYLDRQDPGTRGNSPIYLLILGTTVLVILLFAVINYINLSVAQSGFRAQEAAMRLLLGSTRGQLFASYVTESLLICSVSFVLALLFASTVEPWCQNVLQTKVSLSEGATAENIAVVLAGVVTIGGASGLVPAYVLTRFKPIDVVRGTFRRKTKMVYSKVLIVFQYVITIVLIGCSVTIVRQLDFMRHSDLGFDTEQVVVCRNRCTAEQVAGFRDRLMQIPGVEVVSFAHTIPGVGDGSGRYIHTDIEGQFHEIWAYYVDTAYFPALGIEPLRETGQRQPDGSRIWLNRRAWNDLGLAPDAVEYTKGQEMRHKFIISGMVPDFSTSDFTEDTYSLLIHVSPDTKTGYILIRLGGTDLYGTMDKIGELYNKEAGGNYFDGRFLQQEIDDMYRSQERMAQMIRTFSLLAILISALGMLAMSTYFMRQRAQEVAVRKVFGATDREVLVRLISGFLKLVAAAFVVAVPAIWYLMNGWLNGYAYRIPLSWTIFAAAGAVAFVIAFGTVLWQSLKATRTNPVLAVRD